MKSIEKIGKVFTLLILALAIFLGILTRFYKLGQAPAGLYLDEAAQGYSAYSILKTGKDEFGKSFPVVFRSFTDFKTPIYIYLLVPLIPIFGLSKFTVRFPSFIFSVLSLPLIYLLIRKICSQKIAKPLSLLTSLLLAISPWHILFGRTNFECNVALFFFLAGIYFFYQGLKKPSRLLISAIMLAIAIPSYHSQRLITPLMLLLLFIRHRQVLLGPKHRRFVCLGLLIGLLISLPTLSVAFSPGFLARASGLNIFSHQRQMPTGFLENYRGPLTEIINSSWFLSTQEFLSLYLSYFSPRNMFVLGDYDPRSSFPELSTFFLWQFPFYLYGLYLIFKNKSLKELRFLTLALLLISPLPAAVTRDPYSTIRALPMVIPQLIIISLGLIKAFQILKKPIFKLATYGLFGLILIYSMAKLYSSVIVLNEHFRAKYWNYGWEQVVEVLHKLDPHLPVVVDTARSEPYSQILFFLKFEPTTYQQENQEVPLSQYYTNMSRNSSRKIGNIITRVIDWEPDLLIEQYFVGDALAISQQQIAVHKLKLIEEIDYPDGSVAFRIVKTNP